MSGPQDAGADGTPAPTAGSARVRQRDIMITGGSGFIGSHLTRHLLAAGHRVTVVDAYTTGSRDNLADLEGHPDLMIMEHDVIDSFDPQAFAGVEQIYHLACAASPVHYQRDPVHTLATCAVGSLNVLNLAVREGATVLLSSTSEVYGDPLVHPQDESYWGNVNPTGIRACYDEGKRWAEAAFFSFHRMHDVSVKVARIFNTYGPSMQPDDGRVVSNFIVQALRDEPLRVLGDGSQTRSFCYVDDLVRGLVALMDSPRAVTGPINLGSTDEVTISELAELTLRAVGSDQAVSHGPLPGDDPTRRRPAIDLARTTLGWEPTTSLQDGLAATVAYFRNQRV